jgi:hypothetical protein
LLAAQERLWLRGYWRTQGELYSASSRRWDLPVGISVRAATRAFETLAERHEILRTAFTIGPDNYPIQIVFDTAGFRLPLSLAPLDTLHAFLEDLEDRGPLLVGVGSPRAPWTVRFFTDGDDVRVVLLIFDNIVSDGTGGKNWLEQFLALCRGDDPPRPSKQPLDRQAEEADRFRPDPGRSDPAARSPQIALPGAPEAAATSRYLKATVTFDGVLAEIDRICRRGLASRPMVLMYALGWLISRLSGHPHMLCASYLANREAGDSGVDCLMRPVDLLVEIDDNLEFGPALDALATSTLRAYESDVRQGPLPPESRAQTAAERGVAAVVPVYFNFWGDPRPDQAGDVRDGGVSADRTDQRGSIGRPWCMVVWIYVESPKFAIQFEVDTAMVSDATTDAMCAVLPRLLRFMADEPSARAGSADALLPAGFRPTTQAQLVGPNWVNLRTVERVLRGCPGLTHASVEVADGELVARVTLDGRTQLFDVHEHVLASLQQNLDIAAPTRYVRTDGKRGAAPLVEVWRPASSTPELAPATSAEREVCEAIRETHGHGVNNVALSYVAAGGKLLLAPAVVETLRVRGLEGLHSGFFTSPRTLRSVARALVPVAAPAVDGASYVR